MGAAGVRRDRDTRGAGTRGRGTLQRVGVGTRAASDRLQLSDRSPRVLELVELRDWLTDLTSTARRGLH